MIQYIIPLFIIPLAFALNVTATLVSIQTKNISELVPYTLTIATQVSVQNKTLLEPIPYTRITAQINTTQTKPPTQLIPYTQVMAQQYITQTNRPPSLEVVSSSISIKDTIVLGNITFIIHDNETTTAICYLLSVGITMNYFVELGTVQTNTKQTLQVNKQLPEAPAELYLYCISDIGAAKTFLARLWPLYILRYKVLYSPSYIVIRIPNEFINRTIYKITYVVNGVEKLLPPISIQYKSQNILIIKLPEPATEIKIYMV